MRVEDLRSYYTNPRPEVVEHFPSTVRRHLDVGCGAGTHGELVHEKFKAETWGVELDPEAAAVARERLDYLYEGDALAILPKLPWGHFDVVTFNDVLEHFAYPWDVLRMVRPLLAPGGVVIASLPNLRNWDALQTLVLDADFPYEDQGIFDRTHLRFFTEKSAARLFAESGFEVVKQVGINGYVTRRRRWLGILNRLTGYRFRDCVYLQWLLIARVHDSE